MEEIKEIIEGICPSCNEETRFKYAKTWKNEDSKPVHLYTCWSCKSSRSLNSIQKVN